MRNFWKWAAAAKSLQSCPTQCDPGDSSLPGSPVPGIFQARTLEWVAISFSNAWKWKVKVKLLSHVRLPATPWTAAYQAPPSMGFARQEYWSGKKYLGGISSFFFFLSIWETSENELGLLKSRRFSSHSVMSPKYSQENEGTCMYSSVY